MTRLDKKVLVVDDLPTVLKQAVEILGERYDVDTAASGTEALEKVQSYRPDIVLMDMNMPDKSGITCTEEIHALPDFKLLPIIITVNDMSVMSNARAYEHGVSDVVKKPFIANSVYRKIDMHLKLSEIGWQYEP